MPKDMEVKVFLEVCHTLNFTKASDNLFLSQQACSRYISHLEQEVGFPLFERTTRKVTLTREGELLHQVLQESQRSYESVLRIGRAHAQMEAGVVRVGVMNMTNLNFLAQRYQRFLQNNTDITVSWTYKDPGHLKQLLTEDAIDIAILSLASNMDKEDGEPILNNPTYRTTKLCDSDMYLHYSPFHPMADKYNNLEDFHGAIFSAFAHYHVDRSNDIFRAKRRLEQFGIQNAVIRLFDTIEEANLSVLLGETIAISSERNLFFNSVQMKSFLLGPGNPMMCVWKNLNQNPRINILVKALTRN